MKKEIITFDPNPATLVSTETNQLYKMSPYELAGMVQQKEKVIKSQRNMILTMTVLFVGLGVLALIFMIGK